MTNDLKHEILSRVPDQADIRRRLAENLQERDLLRKLLRLADQKARVQEFGTEGSRNE